MLINIGILLMLPYLVLGIARIGAWITCKNGKLPLLEPVLYFSIFAVWLGVVGIAHYSRVTQGYQ